MPRCGIIRKSDLNTCTNEGIEKYEWKCKIHEHSKREEKHELKKLNPSNPKILTKPTVNTPNSFLNYPKDLINIIVIYKNK